MKRILILAVAVAAAFALPPSAQAATTAKDGVVTLDNSTGPTSYEFTSTAPVADGTQITFEYRVLGDGDDSCTGGTPRVFVQGGAYNTHDGLGGEGPCEERTSAPDADGWRTVTGTITGVTEGSAGLVGIVNDNQSNTRTIEVRNLVIGTTNVLAPPAKTKDDCKNGGFQSMGFKNQGACVSSFQSARPSK